MNPMNETRSWMPSALSGWTSFIRDGGGEDGSTPQIDSCILDDMRSLAQPVSLCAPDTGKAAFWFNLHDRLFGSKELDRDGGVSSSSFSVQGTDQALVLHGTAIAGQEWKVTIRPNTSGRRSQQKYAAIVEVDATRHADLIVYGRPLNVTIIGSSAASGAVRSAAVRRRHHHQGPRDDDPY